MAPNVSAPSCGQICGVSVALEDGECNVHSHGANEKNQVEPMICFRIAEQPQRWGRPKQCWGSKVSKLATGVVRGADIDDALFSNLKWWKILARS